MSTPPSDGVREAMMDLLHKAMTQVEPDLVINGYVVLCWDRTPAFPGEGLVPSIIVLGPFDTELEAVEYAVTYHEQVNRGLPPDSPEGYDTAIKPIIDDD